MAMREGSWTAGPAREKEKGLLGRERERERERERKGCCASRLGLG